MDCLFCKIIAGEIPSKKLYEDDHILAFYDIAPAAPVHFLVIPKQHIGGVCEFNEQNAELAAYIFAAIPKLAALAGLTDYRVIANNGRQAGQTVFHLHFHVLGGKSLGAMCE